MESEMCFKDRYRKMQKVGEGAYGCVYKAEDLLKNKLVALKIIKLEAEQEGIPSTTLREITILRSVNHQNIVKLIDVNFQLENTQQRKLTMVFQYVSQDLSKHMRRLKTIQKQKDYFHQILKAVTFLHQNKIFHRDLKPQNILISSEGVIKLADFGLGRIVNYPLKTMSKQIETLWYRAPQLLFGCQRYDLAVDIWSLGCIFYELSENCKILFHAESQIELIFKIFEHHGAPTQQQWPQLRKLPYFKTSFPKFKKKERVFQNMTADGIDLLDKLIALNPKKRITAKEALNHRYFKD